ncbi:MAG: FecR domain-containing protein [Treponema sp.]|nr:FecR domain-containing protein [Treponema sp.]
MQKKIKFRSPLIDFLVVVFCLSVSGCFIWLFWQDLNKTTSRTDKDAIATISFKHNIAQRKYSDRIVWERLQQNTPLYDNDFIRTVDLAQATIRFKDGTTLDVYENSMLQVSYSEETGVRLSIDGGDIQVAASEKAKNVAIRLADGSTVNMDAGASLSARSDTKENKQNIEVKGGSANVQTQTGQVTTVSFGQSVNIGDDAEIEVVPLTVISPAKETRLLSFVSSSRPVSVEWRQSGSNNQKVTVQTSRTKDFKELLQSKTITEGNKTQIQSAKGTIYWRVFNDSTKDNPSTGRITTELVPPVNSIAPQSGTNYTYRLNKPRITFRWQANGFADSYRFMAAKDSAMKEIVSDITTTESFVNLDSLESGTYYWQVMPYYSLNDTGYLAANEIRNFTVTQSKMLASPELLVPPQGSELTYKQKLNATFMWKSDISAEYQLLVAKDREFSSVIIDTKTKTPRYTAQYDLNSIQDGTYYWKVIRNSGDAEDVNNESQIRSFKVSRIIPGKNLILWPQDGFTAESDKLKNTTFSWQLSDTYEENTKSVFQVSKEKNFDTTILNKTLDSPSIGGITLDSGKYYWRAGVLSDDGKLQNPTATYAFTIVKPLVKPIIINPLPEEEVLLYGNSKVEFEWNLVDGADSYNVKVYDKKDNLVAQNPSVKDTSIEFALPPGSYSYKVQAVSSQSVSSSIRMGEASERSFSVRKPSVVKQLSPSPNSHIAGLKALREPVVLQWKSGSDPAKNYSAVLQKQQANGHYKTVQELPLGSKTTASLNRLPAGTYRWQVNATTRSKIPVNSEQSVFVIDPIPALSRPVTTSPKNGFVIGPEFLRSNRQLNFRWQAVPGASEYSFNLFKRQSDGTLKNVFSVKSTKNTGVTLKDFSILDVGTFIWNVKAFSIAKDGFKEQESPAAESNFIIDFNLPEEVESIKPETMYAN